MRRACAAWAGRMCGAGSERGCCCCFVPPHALAMPSTPFNVQKHAYVSTEAHMHGWESLRIHHSALIHRSLSRTDWDMCSAPPVCVALARCSIEGIALSSEVMNPHRRGSIQTPAVRAACVMLKHTLMLARSFSHCASHHSHALHLQCAAVRVPH